MNERERSMKGGAADQSGEGPLEEHLRAAFTAAYPRVKPSESLRQRIAAETARHDDEAARRSAWWHPWWAAWRPAAGVLTAALLLVVLGLMLVRMERGRSPGRLSPSTAPIAYPPRNAPGLRSVPPVLGNDREPPIARAQPGQPGALDTVPPPPVTPATGSRRPEAAGHRPPVQAQSHAKPMRSRRQIAPEDDLAFVNPDPKAVMRRWAPLPRDDWEKIEERVRRSVRMKDDFVQIPFPRLAAASSRQIVAAVEQYKHEAAIVDPRLSREVTLSFKSAALSDVCDELHAQTGIQLTAGPSVADEKVTIFCEKMPLRQVMRAINHLLGDTWLRSREALGVRRQALGEKTDDPNAQHPTPNAEYRYELEQDLRSQLLEEELRNRDRNAALLALDAEMQQYRPYLSMSPDELKKQWDQQLKGGKRSFWERPDDSREVRLWYLVAEEAWGGVQLYYRLSPRGRAALMAGQELVFKPDAPDPDRRLPDELCGAILRSLNVPAWDNGHPTRVAELPGVRLEQVRLRLDRSELGKLSLIATMAAVWGRADNGLPRVYPTRELATGLSPSEAKLDNASANAALRGHSPFDQRVSLRPEPSCPVMKRTDPGELDQVLLSDASHDLDPSQPYASSADVWEAVHRATGLPIVADYYTHLYPLSLVSVQRQPLFEALCSVGDALRARWRKEGDFLLCRSTSYFWDKLKEVPNRYLQRWAHDREASGALPLVDFLEMAGMADQQLGSQPVGQGIEHYWGLREWAHLRDYRLRHDARCVALLMPEQLRRAQEPAGLPVRELTPAQQQGILRLQFEKQEATEREGGWSRPIRPEEFANTRISATYVPAGWYLAFVVPQYVGHVQSWTGPWDYAGGRTAAEAAAAARRLYPGASPVEVHYARDGFFRADISTP